MTKDTYERTVGYRLVHAARLQRARTARQLSTMGLHPGQEQVLKLLATEDGRTMGDLAEALRIRPPTASKTIARLTQQGLVERRPAPSDARLVRVHLTAAGRERAESVESLWRDVERDMTLGLDGKERKRLRKLLRRVEENLVLALGGPAIEEVEEDEDEAA